MVQRYPNCGRDVLSTKKKHEKREVDRVKLTTENKYTYAFKIIK